MRTDSGCVFCRIVAGEIPSIRVYEDEDTLAFMDINPANPGHALAISREHWQDLHEVPAELAGAVLATAKRVAAAVEAVVSPAGINIVQANGAGAGQSVYHFHVHVLPRRENDQLALNWGLRPGDMDEIRALGERIRAVVGT